MEDGIYSAASESKKKGKKAELAKGDQSRSESSSTYRRGAKFSAL